MRVGVIGLGNIGGNIATNLVADGHDVVVLDLDASRVALQVESGARSAPDAAAVASHAEVTFLSLPTPDVTRAVAEEWLVASSPDAVLVDLSTNAPSAVREIGARVEERGRAYLEAPLTGGASGAKARILVFMVGGPETAFKRVEPLLDKLGRAVFYLGELGRGNTAKLVNSLLAFTSTWVSMEGLTLAAKSGIDLRTMVNIIRTGGAGNFYVDRMVEGINRRGGPVGFALALAAKDARLITDLAKESGVPVPVATGIEHAFTQAVEAGLGERDWAEIVELIESKAGIRLHLAADEASR